MTTPTPYPRALLADHQPYIQAVADHLTAAGLTVANLSILTSPRRAAIIRMESSADVAALHWDEAHGWQYADSVYDDDTPEDLPFANVVDPPAIVLSALISESWTARAMLRAEIPDDQESALAAYAPTAEPEPTGPRPGQEVADRDDDLWTYIDTGADGLRLIDPDLLAHVWTPKELDEKYGPLESVRAVELPAEEAR